MEIVQKYLTQNPCYQAGKKIQVKGLMLHSVGCPQQSAEAFVNKWNNPESKRACVHAFIDGSTGKVYQTLPWDHRGWHAGGPANNTHIGVEMCEPSCISYTGGAAFQCSDLGAALAVVKITYDSAVELFAMLCKQYLLDPLGNGVIVSHKEGHDRGIASGHADPEHLWNGLQTDYTMEKFRGDVASAVGQLDRKPLAAVPLAESNHKEDICVGDMVKVNRGAVYYSGKEIPEWVLDDVWKVKSISGDRVVIDTNEAGTRAICSPVSIQYLKKNR